jgi:RND family efflux transporter MFP subunit
MNLPPQTIEQPAPTAQPVAEQISARLLDFQVADHERRGSGPRKRRWLWLLMLLVLSLGGMAGYSYRTAHAIPEADVFVYSAKPAKDVLLDLSGFVVPRKRIIISPQVSGIVARVLIPEEGKKVKTGDLLFEVEPTRYQAEFDQAEAALATAQAQLLEQENGHEKEEIAHARAMYKQAKVQEQLAEVEYERARKLYPLSMGKAEFDKTLTSYRDAKAAVEVQKTNLELVEHKTRYEKIAAARAEVKRCQAAYDRAKYYLGKTKILAPPDSDGKDRVFTVLQKNVNPGESIQADFVYTTLCTLADLSEMEAEIDVQERDLRLVAVGTPCEIVPDAYPDRVYPGRLNRMQPLVSRQRGVVSVKVTIDHPDEFLLPDMNARVLFLKTSGGSVPEQSLPRIPVRALVPQSDPPAVFVLDGSLARLRRIQVGDTVGDGVQIQGGLQPEDKVLLPDGQPLQDGKPVRLRGQHKDDGRKDAL